MLKRVSSMKKPIAVLLTFIMCCSFFSAVPAASVAYAAQWAPAVEQPVLVVTGTGIVGGSPQTADLTAGIAREKSYTRDELTAMEAPDYFVYSWLNQFGTQRIYKAKGVALARLFENTAFTPAVYDDFAVSAIQYFGSGGPYTAKFNFGDSRYYFPASGGAAVPVSAIVATKAVYNAPPGIPADESLDSAAPLTNLLLLTGQLNEGDWNSALANSNTQKILVGEELPAILTANGKSYTRAEILMMPRYTDTYTYPSSAGEKSDFVRGVPISELLAGCEDWQEIEFISTDSWPNPRVTVGDVRNADNKYILAYETFDSSLSSFRGIYDSGKNDQADKRGCLTVYAAGKSPVKMICEIKVYGGVDWADSPYKHIKNGGLPGSAPYNIDAITGATLTVEGPGLVASTPISVRQLEEENAGLFRGNYTDNRPAATTLTYEGLKLSHILSGMDPVLTGEAANVAIKDRWRNTIAEFTLEQIKEADEQGKPVIVAYGTSSTDVPPTKVMPFQFDGRLGIDSVLGNGDGCIKLVYDKTVFAGGDPNPAYTKFGNMAYIYVGEDYTPGYKHDTAPYDLPENTQYVVTVTGDKIGREVNYTVEQLEAMVEYDEDGNPADGGMGYRDEYSLANSNYWYVNEYEGVKLWDLLQKAGIDQSDMSVQVKFRATDGYTNFDEFTLAQISDPDLFGYYQKGSEDDNTGNYIPKLTLTNPDDPDDPEWVCDLLDVGYPVLLAYGVNKYPYVISNRLDGFKSGLGNDGGPVRIISGKTDYHHANGSRQAKLLDKIIVGNEVNYSTHKSNPAADGVYQALAGNELKISVLGEGGVKIKEVSYTVAEIEDLIYGAGISNTTRQAALIKDFYGFVRGGNTYTDLYEGVNFKYFLENIVQIPGSVGFVEIKNSAGSSSVTLPLEDLALTGGNAQSKKEGLCAILAFAKNGYPMVSASGSAGYISSYTDGNGQEVTVANSNGPLAFATAEIDGVIKSLADVGEIIVTINADKYAHIGEPYDSFAAFTLTVGGEGTYLDDPVAFTVAGLEGKQNLALTADYSILDDQGRAPQTRYRGLDLYAFLTSSDVRLRANAEDVIITYADGLETSFPLAEVMQNDYVNTVSGTANLKMILAYGSSSAAFADRDDGKPLVGSPADEGYDPAYGNSGGPLLLVVGQSGPGDVNAGKLLQNVTGITVTAGEMSSFNHSSNATYQQYLSEKYRLTVRESGTNNILFDKEYTLGEIEAMSGLIVSDEYTYTGTFKEEGIDLWRFILQEAGYISTINDPIAVNIKAGDGFTKNVMEFGLDALQYGITDGAARKIIILSYATNDKPLVPDENSPGYASGNAGGPLRLITHNSQGSSLKDVRSIEVVVGAPSEETPSYDFDVYRAGGGLPMGEVRAVVPDKTGGVWIGTNGAGAAYISADGEITNYSTYSAPALRSDFVTAIAIDQYGGVWLSQGGSSGDQTTHQGAAYFKDDEFTFFNRDNSGLPNNRVYGLDADEIGNVWFATTYNSGSEGEFIGGLTKYTPLTGLWSSWTRNDGLPTASGWTVKADNKGGAWLTTYRTSTGGVDPDPPDVSYVYINAAGEVIPYNIPAENAYTWSRSIAIDPQGGVYITRSSGAHDPANTGGRLDFIAPDGSVKSFSGDDLIPDLKAKAISSPAFYPEIRMVFADSGGDLWLSTNGLGVYRCVVSPDGGISVAERYAGENGDWPVERIFDDAWSVYVSPDGLLCIGSNGGAALKQIEITPVEPVVVSAVADAFVTKLQGNKNNLTITIIEELSDGTNNIITNTFSINNNAADTYTVGNYKVFVDTKGNTQIRECRIIEYVLPSGGNAVVAAAAVSLPLRDAFAFVSELASDPGGAPGGSDGGSGSGPAVYGGNLTVDYNSGDEKKFVITGPLVPLESEKVYTESELKEKFATDKQRGDRYTLTMLNTFPTKNLNTIRGVSLWDVFDDAGLSAEVYRNANSYLYTCSPDNYWVAIGKDITVGGAYVLHDIPAGTLDQPRYKYSVADYYAADVYNPDLNIKGEEIPWYIAFAETSVPLLSLSGNFPADATDTGKALRPYFGQLSAGYPNLPLAGSNTYRIVFADELLNVDQSKNYPPAGVFSLLGTVYDRANIMTGPLNGAEKIKGHYQPNSGAAVYFEGSGVASLLAAASPLSLINDADYFSFTNASDEMALVSYANIKSGNYTLVYATGYTADNLAPTGRAVNEVKYYFDLYRDGQPVAYNISAISRAAAPAVDKTALEVLIGKAGALQRINYTPESWAAFVAALTEAQNVFDNGEATQSEVNAVLNALQTQKDALEEAELNVLTIDYNSGAEKKIVVTGSLISVQSEKVYTESELKAKFTNGSADEKQKGNLYGLSAMDSYPRRNMYTIRGVSIWDLFADAGVSEDIYRNPDNYLLTAGTDNYTVTVTDLDADRYRYPANSFLNGLESGREVIPWYIAFSESSSPTGYPADGENAANALRTWFGQLDVNDVNSGISGKWTYRLFLTDELPANPEDVHNNPDNYVFSLLGKMYDRAGIMTGPASGKNDGITLGEKVKGRFAENPEIIIYFEGVSVSSLLKAATNGRVEDTDWFAFTSASGKTDAVSFADIQSGNYIVVYAAGNEADNVSAIDRTIGNAAYYFDLYCNGLPVIENVVGIENADAPFINTAALEALIAKAETLKETDYPAVRWAYFTNVLSEAKTVLANPDKTNDQVGAAQIALQAAMTDMGALPAFQAETLTLSPGSSERDINFAWYSDSVDNKASVVQVAKKSAATGGLFPSSGLIVTTNGTVGNASTGKVWHKAGITGLDPGTEYLYRVSNDGLIFGEINTFTTRAEGAFRFIAAGDPQIDNANQDIDSLWPSPPQTTIEGWADTVAGIAASFPDAAFIATVGDNVDSGGNESQWAGFFAPDALRSIPLSLARGNHDNVENLVWHSNMPNGVAGGNYFFKYNNALFVVLNTADRADETTIGAYSAQFDVTLQAATEAYPAADWLFVIHHKSTASPGPHSLENDVKVFTAALGPLMDKYHVDFVLAGHDHLYSRSWVINDNKKVAGYDGDTVTDPKGTVYFTLNTASGLKYSDVLPELPWYTNIANQTKVPQYTAVDVTADSVTFTTYRTDTSTVIDKYTVKKATSTPGDVNGDGAIDIFDVRRILDHINGISILEGNAAQAADTDSGGVIDIFDVRRILDHINGIKSIEG